MRCKRHTYSWAVVAAWVLALGPAQGQLILNQTQPPNTLVQSHLIGPGVFATNVTYNGAPGNVVAPAPSGATLGEIGRFNGANTCIDLTNGVYLASAGADCLYGPNTNLTPSNCLVGGGGFWTSPDIDLSQLTAWPMWQVSGGNNIGNKAVLEFDFVPMDDMVSFRYVFSSEEYERWACSQYNDVFGFFLSGPGISGPFSNNAINLALVPGSLDPVCVNSINSGEELVNANGFWASMDPWEYCRDNYSSWLNNVQYYKYNGGLWPFPQPPDGMNVPQLDAPYNSDPYYIQHNGLTVVLTASAAVQCGQTYHIKMGVGNVGDNKFPSAVWIEKGSFTSSDRFALTVDPGPTVEFNDPDTVFIENDCDSVYLRIHRHGGFYLDEYLQMVVEGEATNGVDILPALPDSVHFNQLDSSVVIPIAVPVDADGPEELIIKLITCNGQKEYIYQFLIDQKPPLEVELEDVTLTCPGLTIMGPPVVSGGSGQADELTYLWNTGDTTASIEVFVEEDTQFWVTVRDCWTTEVTDSAWVLLPVADPLAVSVPADEDLECLASAILTGTVTGGYQPLSYSWTLNGNEESTTVNVEVLPADPAEYHVFTATDACGNNAQDSVRIGLLAAIPIELALTPDTAIPCLGSAVLVAEAEGGNGELSFQWTQGGTVLGNSNTLEVPSGDHVTYTVTVGDACGQTVTGSVLVTVGAPPPLAIEAYGDTLTCPGMEAILQVVQVTGGGGDYHYQWNPSSMGSTGTSLSVTVDQNSWFTVTVTDDCGSTADTTLAVIVRDYPPLVLSTPNDTVVCPGEQVTLWVIPQGGAGGYTYNWDGLGTDQIVNWTALDGGLDASVTVTDLCGNTANAAIQVDVPEAEAWIVSNRTGENSWAFIGNYNPPGSSLLWNFGDGTTATWPSGGHAYSGGESYWVVFTVTTPEGCTAVDSLLAEPPAAIYFPNAFTPNNDGHNDLFGGEGHLIEEYELLVFNRWGQVIFESHDINKQWDGTASGQDVPQGVYPFKYYVKGTYLGRKHGFGHVTLLR